MGKKKEMEDNKKLPLRYQKFHGCKIVDSIGDIKMNEQVTIAIKQDFFTISPVSFKTNHPRRVEIPYENISDTKVRIVSETSETDRSVISRGVAGGVLFGPVGAAVGALSGTKPKKKVKYTYFLDIQYKPDKYPKTVTFVDTSESIKSFERTLRKVAKLDEKAGKEAPIFTPRDYEQERIDEAAKWQGVLDNVELSKKQREQEQRDKEEKYKEQAAKTNAIYDQIKASLASVGISTTGAALSTPENNYGGTPLPRSTVFVTGTQHYDGKRMLSGIVRDQGGIWNVGGYHTHDVKLLLVPESDNEYDPNAVAVFSDYPTPKNARIKRSGKIGYIPKPENASLDLKGPVRINAVVKEGFDKFDVRIVLDQLKPRVHPSIEAPEKEQPSADKFNESHKFKELLDEGVITNEEFAAKKQELLGI